MSARAFAGRTAAMAKKEAKHIARDPFALSIAFGMPLLLLVLFGFAVSFDIDDLTLAVVDADRTPSSRRLVDSFTATGIFRVVAAPNDADDVEGLFRRGEAGVAVVIPAGFHRGLARGGNAGAQVLVDGADSTTAQTALAYAAGVAQAETRRRLEPVAGAAVLPLRAEVRTLFNPEMRSTVFIVPGMIALVLATVATLLTALTIAREWERGNVEQLFATPIGRLEIILGKLAPYLVMGFVQVLLLLALGVWVFDIPLQGSLFVVCVMALLFIAAMLAQGVFLGALTRHQQVAVQASVVTTMLPSMLLSGFIFPVDNMPAPLQALSAIVPARYLIDALRTVLLKGGGFADLVPNLVALTSFTLLMTVLATRRFRRTLA